MALVLYRKYRPKTFDEVIGQEHVVRTLKNAVDAGRIGHAYLFSGPRGTGKTTVARLLAKSAACEDITNGESCNTCVHCSAILEGRHPDLIEIDAASNRGIDEIRALKDGVRSAPIQASKKIYIIDETHMLTEPAFNALLKTLEEPPAHVIFILATTEINKVPPTIQSRTQRFDFKTVALSLITQRLAKIVDHEGAQVTPRALELIAESADGSVRDAESMLEQVLSFTGGAVDEQETVAILGLADVSMVRAIADAISQKATAQAIEAINDAVMRGVDAVHLTAALASYLRDVLLFAIDPQLEVLIAQRTGTAYLESARIHAQAFSPQELSFMIPKIVEALELIKRSPVPQLPLELAIVEIVQNSTSGVSNNNGN